MSKKQRARRKRSGERVLAAPEGDGRGRHTAEHSGDGPRDEGIVRNRSAPTVADPGVLQARTFDGRRD
jgi:hypothetical protein